jgi:hypothetical protein
MDASSTRAVKKVRKAPAGARWRVAVVAMALMHVATAPASGTVAHPGVPRSGESGHAHGAAEAPGQSLPPSAHNVELVGRLTFDDAARSGSRTWSPSAATHIWAPDGSRTARGAACT